MAARSCRFTEQAETDLTEIALYVAIDSPVRALGLVAELRQHCSDLTDNPARYRLREEYGTGVRVAVHGRYLIFYCEATEAVIIERILHSGRHLDWVQL